MKGHFLKLNFGMKWMVSSMSLKYIYNCMKVLYYRFKYKKCISVSAPSKSHYLPHLYASEQGTISIRAGFRSERNTSIECYGGGMINIGNNVFMNSNVKVVSHKKIEIGNGTVIGPNVCIYDHDHDWRRLNMQERFVSDDIVIGNNVWIGANCTILKGSYIGDGCVVAAGTTLKGKYSNNSLIYQSREVKTRQKIY